MTASPLRISLHTCDVASEPVVGCLRAAGTVAVAGLELSADAVLVLGPGR